MRTNKVRKKTSRLQSSWAGGSRELPHGLVPLRRSRPFFLVLPAPIARVSQKSPPTLHLPPPDVRMKALQCWAVGGSQFLGIENGSTVGFHQIGYSVVPKKNPRQSVHPGLRLRWGASPVCSTPPRGATPRTPPNTPRPPGDGGPPQTPHLLHCIESGSWTLPWWREAFKDLLCWGGGQKSD